jgi:hypothetical protein
MWEINVNILVYLREIDWGGMDLINMAQDKGHWGTLVNSVMNIRVPEDVGKFLSS